MTTARPQGLSPFKLALIWAMIALGTPGLRLVNWINAPDAHVAASADSDLPDLEPVFADAPRYYAYAQATLGRPYDSYYIRPVEGWREDRGPPHRLTTPDHALTPWRDFSFEYPPGALVAILPPALLASGVGSYCVLFALEMGLCFALALAMGMRAAERLKPGAGATVLQFGVFYYILTTLLVSCHYDALVALTLAGFAFGVAASLPMLAALSLAAAVLVKGAPVLLIPLALAHFLFAAPWRKTAGAALAGAVALAGAGALYFYAAGAHAFDMFAYHSARPLQIESPYGAIAVILDALGLASAHPVESFGSVNVVASYEPAMRALSGPLTALAALAVIAWRLWRLTRGEDETTRARRTIAASAALMIVFMALGKVFSPQYVVWLFPLALLPAAAGDARSAKVLIAAVLLTQIEFPFLYQHSVTLLGVVALARAALLLATAWLLTTDGARARRPARLAPSASLG